MVAALALTLRKRKDVRAMDPGLQVRVKRSDRVRIVQMAPEVEDAAAPEAPAVESSPGQSPKGAA